MTEKRPIDYAPWSVELDDRSATSGWVTWVFVTHLQDALRYLVTPPLKRRRVRICYYRQVVWSGR